MLKGVRSVVLMLTALVMSVLFSACSNSNDQEARNKNVAPSQAASSQDAAVNKKAVKIAYPNIIFLVIDALRADHLGCYGYQRNTSPNIDKFSSSATVYSNAQSTAPWTLPSHASMFTGLYPQEHHIVTNKLPPAIKAWRDNYYKQNKNLEQTVAWRKKVKEALKRKFGETVFKDLLRNEIHPLPQEDMTIAEHLKDCGYQTAAFAANSGYLGKQYQLDQGFETYEVQWGRAGEINEKIYNWLDTRDQKKPFFLFVNYMDTHVPYNDKPRPNFLNGKEIPKNSNKFMAQFTPILGEKIMEKNFTQTVVDQYDLGIANMDAGIAKLFKRLKDNNIFNDSLIILTSDHGEYLGDHHLITHSKDVYQSVMWVPLIIKSPKQNNKRMVDKLISTVYIPGMIVDSTGWNKPNPFRDTWRTDRSALASNYYTRVMGLLSPFASHFERVRKVVYRGNYKYIDSSDGNNELYDLKNSPKEQHNIIKEQPAIAEELKQILRAKVERGAHPHKSQRRIELSPDDVGRLKTLGYL